MSASSGPDGRPEAARGGGLSGPKERPPEPLDLLRDLILAHDPGLAGAAFRLAGAGWDCAAVVVDDRLVFKFPGDPEAGEALEREARLLAVLGPALTLPVPDLRIVREPRPFSRHAMIPGGHLLPSDYALVPEAARHRLAGDLARFLAELHAVPLAPLRAAGAGPAEAWLPPGEIARRALPLLPAAARPVVEATLGAYADLPPDPLGAAFGHFDAHGWNMAWDHGALRLNGVFDFGDSGIGPLHREFIQTSLVSADLTRRVMAAYRRITGRAVDPERVRVLTGTHRLWELAVEWEDADHAPVMAEAVVAWLARGETALTTPA